MYNPKVSIDKLLKKPLMHSHEEIETLGNYSTANRNLIIGNDNDINSLSGEIDNLSLSSNEWNSTYSTVESNSGQWSEGQIIYDYIVTANDWNDLVTALESGTYATVYIPNGTYLCTDNEANPILVHANVLQITGENRDGVIIDADCANNVNIQDFIVMSNYNTKIECLTITNYGLLTYSAIKGTIALNLSDDATVVYNCKFTDILSSNARALSYCNVFYCVGINDSSVGSNGRGIFAYNCHTVNSCKITYFYYTTFGGSLIINNYASKGGKCFSGGYNVVNNYVASGFRGFDNCTNVTGNYADFCTNGYYGCTNIGHDNYVGANNTADYTNCTFNHTERDNTDNTKRLVHDYSAIPTNTEIDVAWQGKDGTVALVGDSPAVADWNQNGFPDTSNLSISFDNSTRTFTLAQSASYDYFVAGVKYTKSADIGHIITDVSGVHVIYFDNDTMVEAVNPDTTAISNVIKTKAIIAIIIWNSTLQEQVYLGWELHGCDMSPQTHAYLHFLDGCRYESGLGLNTFSVDGTGVTVDAQFGIDSGGVYDEDLFNHISAITSTTGLPIYSVRNGEWYKDIVAGYSMRTYDNTDATMLCYNDVSTASSEVLTEALGADFVLGHIFATTEDNYPMICIMGQNTYLTKRAARAGAYTEVDSLILNGTLFPEIKAIATVIYQTKLTYANDINARIVTTDEGDNYIDHRDRAISKTTSTTDHNSLTGLNAGDYQHLTVAEKELIVNGASSATDNALVLFDGTTGKLIKDSAKTIETVLTDDDTHIPTSDAVYAKIAFPITTKTADYTVTTSDFFTNLELGAFTGVGYRTFTLPDITSSMDNKWVVFSNVSDRQLWIKCDASDTIGIRNGTTLYLRRRTVYKLVADYANNNWKISLHDEGKLESNYTVTLDNTMSYAEIYYALAAQPANCNGFYIHFSFSDGTYTMLGNLPVSGYYNGYVYIKGNPSESGLHTNQAVVFNFGSSVSTGIVLTSSASLYVQNIKFYFSSTGSFYAIYSMLPWCGNIVVDGCYFDLSAGTGYAVYFQYINVVTANNYVKGGYIFMYTANTARGYSSNNSSITTSPNYGLMARYGSTIMKNSTQPTGSIANEYSAEGSVIR